MIQMKGGKNQYIVVQIKLQISLSHNVTNDQHYIGDFSHSHGNFSHCWVKLAVEIFLCIPYLWIFFVTIFSCQEEKYDLLDFQNKNNTYNSSNNENNFFLNLLLLKNL